MTKRQKDLAGLVLIGFCLLALAGLFYGAFLIDQANGISVSQSLAMWGL